MEPAKTPGLRDFGIFRRFHDFVSFRDTTAFCFLLSGFGFRGIQVIQVLRCESALKRCWPLARKSLAPKVRGFWLRSCHVLVEAEKSSVRSWAEKAVSGASDAKDSGARVHANRASHHALVGVVHKRRPEAALGPALHDDASTLVEERPASGDLVRALERLLHRRLRSGSLVIVRVHKDLREDV
eukprot:scaffold1696_cov258-Pinguiococcus_pyrenoidosus.AAC.31